MVSQSSNTLKFFPSLSLVLSIFLLSNLPATALAEDPARGVLPDGRAYRTDENGNQLVDYIAELELSVESLERRAGGLEDDVRIREQEIEALKKGVCSPGDIKEVNLLDEKPKAVQCPKCDLCPISTEALKLEREVAKENQNECATRVAQLVDASRQTSKNLEGDVVAIKLNLQQANQLLEEEKAKYSTAKAQWNSEREDLRSQLTRSQGTSEQITRSQLKISELEKRLEDIQNKHQSEIVEARSISARLQGDNATLQRTIEQLKGENSQTKEQLKRSADLSDELKLLQAALVDREQQLKASNDFQQNAVQISDKKIREYEAQIAGLQSEVGKLKKEQEAQLAKIKLSEARAAYYQPRESAAKQPSYVTSSEVVKARDRAVSELRSDMASSLALLRRRIETRDRLFSAQQNIQSSVKVSPSRLVSSRGRSIDAISRSITSASSIRELADLRPDIRELESKINSDIEIAERMFPSANR